MTPRELAISNTKEAIRWVGSAGDALNTVIGFPGKHSDIPKLLEFRAIQTHFHVPLNPPDYLKIILSILPFFEADPAVALMKDIRFKYWDISSVLADQSIFVDAPATGEGEDASAYVPMARDGTIRITPFYKKLGPLSQKLVLIHEAAHFLGEAFQDFAYRDRKGEVDPRKYIDLPVQYAMRNADSYAYFALQMAKGIDRILSTDE